MSLENNLERIAVALEELVRTVQQQINPVITTMTLAGEPETPQANASAPSPEEKKPEAPSFEATLAKATTETAATHTSEFTDNAGLVAYAMRAYTEVGAERGAKIQGALGALGYANINDVKPEHFQGFFDAVEAIKRGE